MSYFDRQNLGDFTCSKCGNVYRIESWICPDKEETQVDCDCGNPIIPRERTRHNYTAKLIGKGKPSDAANNPRL